MSPELEAQWRANNPGQALPDQSNDTPGPANFPSRQTPNKRVGDPSNFGPWNQSGEPQILSGRAGGGGGLSALSNQAAGRQSMAMAPESLPSAQGMSMAQPTRMPSMVANPNIKRKAKGGLGALANQASGMGMMKKPNLTYG